MRKDLGSGGSQKPSWRRVGWAGKTTGWFSYHVGHIGSELLGQLACPTLPLGASGGGSEAGEDTICASAWRTSGSTSPSLVRAVAPLLRALG